MMLVLRSVAFNIAFIVVTTVLAVLGFWVLLLPARGVLVFARLWARLVVGLLRHICGIDCEVRGRENLPDHPVLIAAKHQSAWDTIAINLILPGVAYVMKRELLWVPLVGWYMARAGMIPIDRAGHGAALRKLQVRAKATLAAGRSILIFPEGTRTRPGERRRYLAGIAGLYAALGAPVVPVALNSGLYWPRRSFLKRPGRILVEILPAIAPGLARPDFLALLEDRIETASQGLNAEAMVQANKTGENITGTNLDRPRPEA